jgi:hypothetical protein
MKVVFAGPSLYGAPVDLSGLDLRPPAAHGDVLRAAFDGASVVGLIDGAFEAVAAVWHKEILFALAQGVAMVGGASMGALRAAECAAFGMEAVGQVARAFCEGSNDDDAAVAITHGPVELGSPPLVEALVDCDATIAAMVRAGVLGPVQASAARHAARTIHYKERGVDRLAAIAAPRDPAAFAAAYLRHRVSIKTLDAMAVVTRVRELPDRRRPRPADWRLSDPPMWRDAVAAIEAERTAI